MNDATPRDIEFRSRVDRLRAELRTRNLDALLVDDCEISAYYFNFEAVLPCYRAGIIPTEGEPFFVLRSNDVQPMREVTWIEDIVAFPDGIDVSGAIADEVRLRGLDHARIGIDLTSHALTVQMFDSLRRALPDVDFVDIDGLPWRLRKVKSEFELEKLRAAGAIVDATMQEIMDAARPGFTEREAARMVVDAYMRHGGDPTGPGVVTLARGWDFLHGNLHDTPLQHGDVLHLELSPSFEGYSSRMMRCVHIGDIPPKLNVLSKKMIELQDQQIAAMRAGAVARDVDSIMRQGALDAGIRDEYTNVTGYTLGYYSPRTPLGGDFTWAFLPNSEWTLEEGMVFHMYASAKGVSISETVLVGPDGGERLTKMERRLFSTNESGSRAAAN